jgi:hypothetical protein
LIVGGWAVDRWNCLVGEPQIDRQLAAMVYLQRFADLLKN